MKNSSRWRTLMYRGQWMLINSGLSLFVQVLFTKLTVPDVVLMMEVGFDASTIDFTPNFTQFIE